MTAKSYVTMEAKMCPVCGEITGTNSILLDTRLQERFDHETVTGWGLCPEHSAQQEEGYVFLIGAEAPANGKDVLMLEEANRTGEVIAIKREVAESIFDREILPIQFVDSEVIDMLRKAARYENEPADA